MKKTIAAVLLIAVAVAAYLLSGPDIDISGDDASAVASSKGAEQSPRVSERVSPHLPSQSSGMATYSSTSSPALTRCSATTATTAFVSSSTGATGYISGGTGYVSGAAPMCWMAVQ